MTASSAPPTGHLSVSHLTYARAMWGTTLVFALIVSACGGGPALELEVAALTIEVTSTAFADGAPIPVRYTCDSEVGSIHEDTSPPLSWSGLPQGTRSLALISDDPDAHGGTWVHWVYYAVPPDVTELQEGIAITNELPNGAKQGKNDFKKIGYGGPCPPRGPPIATFSSSTRWTWKSTWTLGPARKGCYGRCRATYSPRAS